MIYSFAVVARGEDRAAQPAPHSHPQPYRNPTCSLTLRGDSLSWRGQPPESKVVNASLICKCRQIREEAEKTFLKQTSS
jgi:hypothetical protein